MKNNELIHFLNSGVKVRLPISGNFMELNIYNICQYNDVDKPYLYPPTVITETINHEGKDEIPLVELAKIEGVFNGKMTFEVDGNILNIRNINKRIIYQFGYLEDSFELWDVIDEKNVICDNQLLLFQYLFSRRINVFGIKAIDPRECSVNPYLITSKK